MSNLSVSTVRAIGNGENRKQDTAAAIVASVSADFDWTARGAVALAIRTACGIDQKSEPAQKTGAKGNQRETSYGVGFRVLSDAVRALVKEDKPVTVALRVSLSGEGGGSTVVPTDHPLYAALVALVTESASEAA